MEASGRWSALACASLLAPFAGSPFSSAYFHQSFGDAYHQFFSRNRRYSLYRTI
jgi:hypothetical protein